MLGKIAQKTAQPRATGEKPISQFPTLDATGVTDNTELTIVESAVNYKINKSEFNKTIKSGSVLFLDWDMVTTPDLTLTADQLNSATKIFIDLTDTSYVAIGSLTLDGAWSADYVEIRIRDRTDRGVNATTSTSISILLGTQSLQTFYFYNDTNDSLIYNIDFDIIKGEFRNPYGIVAYVDIPDSTRPIIGKTPNTIPDNIVYKYTVLFGFNQRYGTDAFDFLSCKLYIDAQGSQPEDEEELLGWWEKDVLDFLDPSQTYVFPKAYMGVHKKRLIQSSNYFLNVVDPNLEPQGFRSYNTRLDDTGRDFTNKGFYYKINGSYYPSLIILEGEYK